MTYHRPLIQKHSWHLNSSVEEEQNSKTDFCFPFVASLGRREQARIKATVQLSPSHTNYHAACFFIYAVSSHSRACACVWWVMKPGAFSPRRTFSHNLPQDWLHSTYSAFRSCTAAGGKRAHTSVTRGRMQSRLIPFNLTIVSLGPSALFGRPVQSQQANCVPPGGHIYPDLPPKPPP